MGHLNRIAAGLLCGLVLGVLFVGPEAPMAVVSSLPAKETTSAGPERPGTLPSPGSDSAMSEPPATTDASAPDSGVELAPPDTPAPPEPPADPDACVQLIEVAHAGGADGGSATHIGDGVYLTCRHVFTDDYGRIHRIRFVRIAGRRVEFEAPQLHQTLDFAVIKTSKSDLPAAVVSTVRPVAGDPLTVIGVKTDSHAGTVSSIAYSPSIAINATTATENGDSGAGVFDADGLLVGVHHGGRGAEIFFTPLSDVSAMLSSAPAAIGPHSPSAPPVADTLADLPSPCVLKFSATWCTPCNSPEAADVVKRTENAKWPVHPIDFESHKKLAESLGVDTLPTFIVVRKHEEYGRYTGTSWAEFSRVLKAAAEANEPTASADAAAAPTPHAEVNRILSILRPQPSETFVDYGCGDGRFVIAAARGYGCRAVGVEIDPERAAEARANVAAAGLADRVEIIEGDALTVDVDADVGVAYLYPDLLDGLSGKLQKLNRFASYLHPVSGLPMENWQGAYVWRQPAPQRFGYWGGYAYSGRVCSNPGCRMCAEIARQLTQ